MKDADENPDKPARTWKQDPEGVRADILQAATAEFAAHGLAGARIQSIADRIQTSKRMIFYYFGDKASLYQAVLEEAYRSVRHGEAQLDLDGLPPVTALERLVAFTFDHHRANVDFIRLVMIENVHGGLHMRNVETLRRTSAAAIDQLDRICEAGKATGVFREDVSPLMLHWKISALSFFNVSNRATFSILFDDSLFSEAAQEKLREQVVRTVLSSVLI
jgi:AcrR family transcriptional regulator